MSAVRSRDGRDMSPFGFVAVDYEVPGVGAPGLFAGLLLNKELEKLTNSPGPFQKRLFARPLASKAFVDGLNVGCCSLRMMLCGRVPNRKDSRLVRPVVVLDSAITSGWLAWMPVGSAIVDARTGRQHGDFTIEASRPMLSVQISPHCH